MREIKKVAVITHFGRNSMGGSVARGFHDAGYEVVPIGYPAVRMVKTWLKMRGSGLINASLTTLARPWSDLRIVGQLRRARPDLTVILKADDIHPRTYRLMRRASDAPLVAFHPDDPFNQGSAFLRRGGPSHPRASDQMRAVDLYLTWSRALVERSLAAGARRAAYLPFACDERLHGQGKGDPESLKAEVTFVGNYDAERGRWLRPVAELGVDFALWGTNWHTHCKDPVLRAAWRGRPLMAGEMATAVAHSAINLNILRLQNKGACNMRTFEIPCAGGFMLTERSEEASAIFAPGEACDDFGSITELCDKIRYWLDHGEERAAIAARGRAVAARHTYTDWCRRLIALTREMVA